MPLPPTMLNSQINLGLTQEPPDNIQHPEVKNIYGLFAGAINNLIRNLEQYCGITQKDKTQWDSLLPQETIFTYNLRRIYVKASVVLTYGTFVNLFNSAGELQARKSDSGAALPSHGYVNNSIGGGIGDFIEVILFEGLVSVSGVVLGTTYYLAPAGAISAAPGVLRQYVGFGVATDLLCVHLDVGAF